MIPAGDIPPNPSELLGSQQMQNVLSELSPLVDFIVFDLPPLNEVSDALVVSRFVDGMVMVVRQNYATRRSVNEAVRQLQLANAKILGYVLTCSDVKKKGYKKKYYSDTYTKAYADAQKQNSDSLSSNAGNGKLTGKKGSDTGKQEAVSQPIGDTEAKRG